MRSSAILLLGILAGLSLLSPEILSAEKNPEPLTMIVMDPLAAELSCPCVAGYAQRKYGQLASHIESTLGRPVKLHFAETLAEALKKKSDGRADLIIGKDSVVRFGAKQANLSIRAVAALTGKDGKTTQTGLVVVPAKDPALLVSDLKGYRILFGPADCDEKHAIPFKLFKENEVKVPEKIETANSCSVAATQVLKLHKDGIKAAAVVSSYAQPLLEGCGTIKKGELRVVGETDPLPFITAFLSSRLNESDRTAIEKALLSVGKHPELCKAMETKSGFVLYGDGKKK